MPHISFEKYQVLDLNSTTIALHTYLEGPALRRIVQMHVKRFLILLSILKINE